MKKLFKFLSIVFAVAFVSTTVSAQDIIIKKDYSTLTVDVIEIGDNYVVYRELNDPTGPTYRLDASKIGKVSLKSGKVIEFAAAAAASPIRQTNLDGSLSYIGRGNYSLDGRELNHSDITVAFKQAGYLDRYEKANRMRKSGQGCIIAGCVFAVLTLCVSTPLFVVGESIRYDGKYARVNDPDMGLAGAITMIMFAPTSGALLAAGIPVFCIGQARLRGIADDYNANSGKYSSNGYKPTLNLTGCRNGYGLGLALNF